MSQTGNYKQSIKPLGKKNYGSIPHLLGSKLGKADKYITQGEHNILTKKIRDKNDFIVVTEKYDGSNVGIARINNKIVALTKSGYLAETSPYKQHHVFSKWVKENNHRFWMLEENERLVGEWMYQVHSLKYKIYLEPFVLFDYFRCDNTRMPYSKLIKIMRDEFIMPRILYFGNNSISINDSLYKLNQIHNHNIRCIDKPEGIVYRIERFNKFNFMAKFVRDDYVAGKYIVNKTEDELIYNVNM